MKMNNPNSKFDEVRESIYARTVEIARLDGRMPHEISQRDYERAKYELTGELDREKQLKIIDFPNISATGYRSII